MTGASHVGHATSLRDYLHVVRRRKWVILLAVVLVPVAAVAFSLHQQKLYQASSGVLLNRQNLANALTGAQDPTVYQTDATITQTQADLARVPAVALSALKRAHVTSLTPEEFLSDSSVTVKSNADILDFGVTNHDPVLAERLADTYAAAYTVFRRQIDTVAVSRALKKVNARLHGLVHAGDRKSSLYANLYERAQQLTEMEALQSSQANVVQTAERAVQVQPKPTRNGILGLVLGIVLGLGLALLREALDTRVRNAQEIGERLGGLPLLARIPTPNKKLRAEHKLVMLEEPSAVQAETFRMLRTNLDFVMIDRAARTLMVTSAVQQEGKSTTIANLAIALARSGQRVVLVDLDLRRPFLDKFFDLKGPGVTQVALGHASLNQALAKIAISDPDPRQARRSRTVEVKSNGNGNGNGNGNAGAKAIKGVLEVLPSGPLPPDPGEFVGTQALTEILEQLRDRADIVLVDAPPMLRVGDAMTLSRKVDAIVVVTRMKLVRRHMLNEFGRQLATVPTPVLGFVVTGSGEDEGYGYGYGYGYDYARPYEQTEKARAGRE
jgi:Mrp family chromosome partitioning ATPase/capsular polysaccharide biosynthesis protein